MRIKVKKRAKIRNRYNQAPQHMTKRRWIYIKNFIMDIMYYLKVNDNTSQLFMSTKGIPQGSVISPTLCNMYPSDFTEGMIMLSMQMIMVYEKVTNPCW